jgi:hypothetical protein
MRTVSALLSLLITANTPNTAIVPHLRVVRSLAAEGALCLRLERRHQVSHTYAVVLLKTTRQSLLSEEMSAKSPTVSRFVGLATRALSGGDERALVQIVSELKEFLGS